MDFDPFAFDRTLRDAATHFARFRRRLKAGTGFDQDPFERFLKVSSRSRFLELAELPDSDPLKQPFQRWVYRLAEQRINRQARVLVEYQRQAVAYPLRRPLSGQLTLQALLHAALRDSAARRYYLSALFEHSTKLTDCTALLWERRHEVALRMGLEHPDQIAAPTDAPTNVAEAWLAETDDVSKALETRELDGFFECALGMNARERWPARQNPHTLTDFFRGTDLLYGLALDLTRLPAPIAPTSFACGLRRLGNEWQAAISETEPTFALACDPYGLNRHTQGALFELLASDPAFLRATLRLDRSGARDHARVLTTALLIETRALALRVLLREAALHGNERYRAAFRELTQRVFGLELPGQAAGGLFRIHDDSAQRMLGVLLAAERTHVLREHYDEDWFRNPRAAEALREEAKRPARVWIERSEVDRAASALRTRIAEFVD